MSKLTNIPTGGVMTKNGVMPSHYNTDSYVSMMESVAQGAQGAAGMGSPTARRMKARTVEGMVPLAAAIAAETSGIGWRIVAEPVDAAMLNGFAIVTNNPDDADRVKKFFDENSIWAGVQAAVTLKRHQGWSVLVLGDEWVRPHGANWITPSVEYFEDYNHPDFGLPAFWEIELKSPIGNTVFIPLEDSILFGDRNYQPVLQTARPEFGQPVLTKAYASLQRLGISHELIISILSLSVQDIYKKHELHDEMKTPGGEASVAKRIGGMAATRQLNDMIAIDEDETIERLQTNMTGVADIMDVAIRVVCADSSFPASRLFDRKGGLTNNDTSGADQWENLVTTIVACDVVPALKRLSRHFLGIDAEFMPNKSQGQIDREVDRDKKVAETVQIYYNIRGITSEEARETARRTDAVELLTEKAPATGTIDEAAKDMMSATQEAKENSAGSNDNSGDSNNADE